METVNKKRKLKSLSKYLFIAQLGIAAGSGKLVLSKGHIDFWMYDTFDPVSAIIAVEGLQNA